MHAIFNLWKRAFQLSQKHVYRVLFAVLLWPALPTSLAAQVYLPFESITQADGLASNYVLCFFQDQQGFIWIGTENGLNRYDGRHFLEFRFDPEDPATLNSNWVSCLFEDSRQNIWIGTNTGLNRLNRATGEIRRIPLLSGEGKPVRNQVRSIYEDERQNIWVSTQNKGLYRLAAGQDQDDPGAEEFSIENPDTVGTPGLDLVAPVYQKGDHLWLNTPRGVDRLDLRTGKVDRFPYPNPGYLSFGDQEWVKTVWDGKDHLITSRTDSLFFLRPSEKEPELRPLQNYFSSPLAQVLPPGPFRHLVMDGPNTLLITRRSNMLQIDLTTGAHAVIRREDDPAADLSPVDITAVFRDRDGNIWLATDGNGILRATRSRKPFRFYEHDPADPASISSGAVRTFAEDNGGGLWVGILNRGLDQFEFDPDNRLRRVRSLLSDPQQANSLSDDEVIQMVKDLQGNLWVASNRGGVNKLEAGTGRIETFMHDPGRPSDKQLSENRIWALAVDPDGQIWAGAWHQGLNRLDPETGSVKRYPAGSGPHSDKIRSLYLDRDSILWIGTEEGLERMNIRTEQFSHFVHDPEDLRSLSSNYVWVTYRDREGYLWVGTNVGLNRFDPDNGTFDRFYEKDGLPSNSIYGLQEDQYGALWISTENGLARKIASGSNTYFQAFTTKDGLGSASFLPKAHFRNERTGELYFGTTDGLVVVAPDLLQQNKRPPRLALNAISIFNPDVNGGQSVTDPFISGKKEEVLLTYSDRVVEFTLSDLGWNMAGGYQYEYKLTGFDRQWMTLEADLKMRFTNLTPGKYTLQARGRTPDGAALDPVRLLTLKVLPPWWKSWWAYSLYLLLTGGLLYGVYRFQLARQLEKMETANLKALNEFKDTVYTNITHEFRTPLTVIKGMIEQVSGHDKIKELIRRNTTNLLDLVNQILDLRKIESGKLKLEHIQADVVLYLRYIMESYQALAELKGVQLHFISREQELLMDFDREKLLRIVSNLLANSIKFTPDGGHIYLDLKQSFEQQNGEEGAEMAHISVTDTGIGIPADEQPFIFDRFYQVRNDQSGPNDPDAAQASEVSYQYRGPGGGSGIGLAMTKDLITLMGGRIDLVSEPGQGATFTVHLPVSRQAPLTVLDDNLSSVVDPLIALPAATEQQPARPAANSGELQKTSLLIIEDNPDVRQYLVSLLEEQYELFLARDGREGVDMALEQIPDLIISDVMMPGKDGFEVCSILKQDERTSHIPIILLTAKASVESRIQGLKRGADAYLAKPFNQEELFVRLEKLAELRRQLKARYQKLDTRLPEGDHCFQQEDAFMAKLMKAVEDNLADPDFGPSQLCKTMGMSRSNLHLKVKALTSRSTSNFVRTVRLHKARELFQTTDLNVNEVAYDVGFNDPSYFSRTFSQEFGINPKAFSSSGRSG